jgi:hypothetical protein
VTNDLQTLRRALREMPVPEPRAGFVDRALARAVSANADFEAGAAARPGRLRQLATRWETWVGAAIGGAAAAALTLLLVRWTPFADSPPPLALTLHDVRNVDVLIDSERRLDGATIRIAASGSIFVEGFENEREFGWRTDLQPGSNLITLPVVARATGKGKLVATIEHEGRTQRVAIDLTVASRS